MELLRVPNEHKLWNWRRRDETSRTTPIGHTIGMKMRWCRSTVLRFNKARDGTKDKNSMRLPPEPRIILLALLGGLSLSSQFGWTSSEKGVFIIIVRPHNKFVIECWRAENWETWRGGRVDNVARCQGFILPAAITSCSPRTLKLIPDIRYRRCGDTPTTCT